MFTFKQCSAKFVSCLFTFGPLFTFKLFCQLFVYILPFVYIQAFSAVLLHLYSYLFSWFFTFKPFSAIYLQFEFFVLNINFPFFSISVAEIPILQMQLTPDDSQLESFTSQQSAILASLSLMGGFDPRPRLGGQVVLDLNCKGVICKLDNR